MLRRTSTRTSASPRARSPRRRWRGATTTAPVRCAWSGTGTRAGWRTALAGADVNPYLAIAAMIAAGLNGIDNKLELEPAFEGNAYDSDKPKVPGTMYEARDRSAAASSRATRSARTWSTTTSTARASSWRRSSPRLPIGSCTEGSSACDRVSGLGSRVSGGLSSRPVIGLPTPVERASWASWRDWPIALMGWSYVRAVQSAGALAVLMPPDDRAEPDELLELIDGLLLVGGTDVDPASYGAEREEVTTHTTPQRDDFEVALARRALERDMPLLGICRGMQMHERRRRRHADSARGQRRAAPAHAGRLRRPRGATSSRARWPSGPPGSSVTR